MLFTAKQDDILKSDWKPVAGNPSYTDCLIRDSSSASSYTYRRVEVENAYGRIIVYNCFHGQTVIVAVATVIA